MFGIVFVDRGGGNVVFVVIFDENIVFLFQQVGQVVVGVVVDIGGVLVLFLIVGEVGVKG